MAVTSGEIGIYGILRNDTTTGILAITDQLYDETTGEFQDTINQELKESIENSSSNLENEINKVAEDLATETADREEADNNLQSQITQETADRQDADNNLQSNIDNEITVRESDIASVKELIQSETTDRTEADASLQEQINEVNESISDINESISDINDSIGTINDTLETKIDISEKGIANGVVPLDSTGLIASQYLPSYVDDVLEYDTRSEFPVTGETGKIYVTLDDNLTYRWSGTTYIEISASLALGETSSTAYPGDKGVAIRNDLDAHMEDYDNPHQVTKSQVGLGNVTNDVQVKASEVGVAGGVAPLNDEGIVDASYLPEVDLSDYVTIETLTSTLEDYVLTSSIKTINGESIIGSGDIVTPNTTYDIVTEDSDGLMSADDKVILNDIKEALTLSGTSTTNYSSYNVSTTNRLAFIEALDLTADIETVIGTINTLLAELKEAGIMANS